ncbi:uncharacterized protein MONOS_15064 [Monocercomonoides exilis]|uniref:uncharacterized protein n=1 Tax=Monocercomonoides exilis TaxID=2049356 RepID=UPI00355954C6|nr:hypothetical protein MONOS_15064 [Monocercomonoides exilis]|eukprot:MONOS_15064.1-p1 / transcript=MONOS_15064.1 / gene=MONOS_15064 / organism=Monocercomonoides_exilis_PA203 / gene_product=unspecified product / transcript_product=unspecified product / location=Mono_scaffold01136:14434-15448(-) / protein_length=316 / sequence_SO=supercontig / SO=protein_coding / is_pseudo=false
MKGKNEKLLADLCECFALMNFFIISDELSSICVPCLLKVASKKKESKEIQKEVEMALLALSAVEQYDVVQPYALRLNDTIEIIKYHQQHHNLTQLAYRYAWDILIQKIFFERNLEDVIVNELHFGREARRELEELTKCVDWKRKKGKEMNKDEAKEVLVIRKWIQTLEYFLYSCKRRNEECIVLINSVVKVFRAAKDNYSVVSYQCIKSLKNVTENKNLKVEDFLKGGAVDAALEGIQLPTIREECSTESLYFFKYVCEKLKEKTENKMEEAKRKVMKRKVLETMEEEGYEDCMVSLDRFIQSKNFFQIFALLGD